MSFSGINVEQRSKEVEALKSFLTYSLIGSLALHIGLLSSGISNYLTRVPTGEEEPIEVAMVDSPTAEPEKPLEKIPEEPKKLPEVVQTQSIETPPVQKPVQEFIERAKIEAVEQPKQTTQNPQPTNTQIAPKPFVPVTTVAPQSSGGGGGGGGGGGSGVGLGSGSGIAVGTSTGTGTGGGTGTGTGGGIGSGTGTGTGSGTGSGTGNRPTVATAPTVPTPPKINSSGNGNGRAACSKCEFKYPESFKRRGIEGRTGLAFDTDEQGNVTNVRVASSSGNRELDEEHLRQAREWKFNPAQGGRRGVRVNSAAFKEDSQRYRQYQQQRKREAEERTRQATTANSTQQTSRRRRRELQPSSTEATARKPAISGFSRRLEPQRAENAATNSSSPARTTRTQGSARESLRSIQREQRATDSSQKPQATIKRRRRDNTSQNKLRESLRGLRQQPQSPQSQPAAPSQE